MKKTAFIILTFFTLFGLKSQNEVDALRYSRTTFGGTARYMAMGGAFGALGADFSSLSSNPGGLGLYKKSEISFTPSLYFGKTISEYNGYKADDSKTNFNVSNWGMIVTTKPNNSDKSFLKYFQFGVGMNRINNFNNRMLMVGNNNINSYVDTYVENANGINYQDIENDLFGDYAFDLNLAWYDYLIDTINDGKPGGNLYRGAVDSNTDKLQRKQINSWGSINEWVIAFGTNINDRLYVGGTFGFPYIRYFEESFYSEEDNLNVMDYFRSMGLYQELETRGGGFNMKFGIIVNATNWVRVGGAIHSPTWYFNMKDYWYSSLSAEYDTNQFLEKSSPIGNYEYELETPWRALGNIAFIIGKVALISLDYEYTDYSKAELKGYDYGFYNENEAIKNKYKKSHNFRAGGEYRIGYWALRAGYAFYGSPFATGVNEGKKNYFTGGLGYRDKNFFIDLAYIYSLSNEDYYLYQTSNIHVNPVKNKYITNNVLLTIGLRY